MSASTAVSAATPYTTLVEPQSVLATSLPTGFDPAIAQLMGQCCELTYDQFATGVTNVNTSTLTSVNGVAYTQIASFDAWEPIAFGVSFSTTPTGGVVNVPYGFVLQATTGTGDAQKTAFYVIALRGTRSFEEWMADAEAFPTSFSLYNSALGALYNGWVHGGFYGAYTRGQPGADPKQERPQGSLAEQVQTVMGTILANNKAAGSTVPLYVTGHSLGGALATLATADIGANFGRTEFSSTSEYWSELAMYTLAAPAVSAGLTDPVANLSVETFVDNFNGKFGPTYAFRVVHAADLVPILPPSSIPLGSSFGLQFAHPTQDVVSFCAQSGSIGGNHSVALYTSFLSDLAAGVAPVAAQQAAVQKVPAMAIGPTAPAQAPAAS